MEEKYPYQKQWEEYRRRRNILFWVFAAPLLVITLPTLFLNFFGYRFEENFGIEVLIFAFFVICLFSAHQYIYHWNCPKCGRKFFEWSANIIFVENCQKCNLPKYKGSTFYT